MFNTHTYKNMNTENNTILRKNKSRDLNKHGDYCLSIGRLSIVDVTSSKIDV